jgi:predicted Zn-dependent protease
MANRERRTKRGKAKATQHLGGSPALDAWVSEAQRHLEAGAPERALAPLASVVISLPPGHPGESGARVALGHAYVAAGRYPEALAQARRAHELEPSSRLPAEVAQRAFLGMQARARAGWS